ncbi:hypothetical protein Cgig2_003826 [Carnegiea gigantea]|uniref:RRM domain-containing protein n=1 Tax=Carnegiea gigantea TaxID=171969 RepID=A0A9Q1QMW7_9CARY|nr:hypothetical protein Cgig2_003826 [Carnegiea gigantea]
MVSLSDRTIVIAAATSSMMALVTINFMMSKFHWTNHSAMVATMRRKFKEHGKVVEVILINDRSTGQQQEYCFLKFTSVEDANRAIAALHNQYALLRAMGPLRVKTASLHLLDAPKTSPSMSSTISYHIHLFRYMAVAAINGLDGTHVMRVKNKEWRTQVLRITY